MDKRTRIKVAAAAGVVLFGIGTAVMLWPEPPAIISEGGPRPEVGAYLSALWAGQNATEPKGLGQSHEGVYLEARSEGALRTSLWESSGTTAEALRTAIRKAKVAVASGDPVDTLVGCVARDFRDVDLDDAEDWNVHRGIRGLELSADKTTRRITPLEMLAKNDSFEGVIGEFLGDLPKGLTRWSRDDLEGRSFECDQFWIPLAQPEKTRGLMRGNDLVDMKDVTREATDRFFTLMGDWMFANLMTDGRMTYKWWPSRNEESASNNQIRQWMASIALTRVAGVRNDAALTARAADNLRYNLAHFYREENGLGLVDDQGKVKLGAVALAALALHLHPARAEFDKAKQALIATTFAMQEADGAFQTLWIPKDPSRPFQNFYTGEALLLWATLYHENPDPALLERFMKSFRYYRNWHLKNRNPAFVPWHTQADYLVWQKTKDPELAAFIFKMNDWLLGVQDWKEAAYADVKGQFYDADRPEFGPPHASSTGVYLEGLADAHALAVELGDEKRAKNYRRAILRGIRASIQLQFQDEVDMFYVKTAERPRALGGLRTRVYHNEIRVDNVQHTLLGVDKVLRTFKPTDFR